MLIAHEDLGAAIRKLMSSKTFHHLKCKWPEFQISAVCLTLVDARSKIQKKTQFLIILGSWEDKLM